MADEIRANYDELSQLASRFATQAQTIDDMTRTVRACNDQLADGGWIGLGAEAFFSEMEGAVLPAVARLIKALQEGAEQSAAISQHMQYVEEEVGGLFRV